MARGETRSPAPAGAGATMTPMTPMTQMTQMTTPTLLLRATAWVVGRAVWVTLAREATGVIVVMAVMEVTGAMAERMTHKTFGELDEEAEAMRVGRTETGDRLGCGAERPYLRGLGGGER
jgi:hypothetical protein